MQLLNNAAHLNMTTPPFTPMTQVIIALKQLLQTGNVGTQEEIRHALAKKGIVINQSKISRLLRKVGAIKMVNDQAETVYSLPKEPVLPPSTGSSLNHLITDISANEVMIVIRTIPGSASIIAHLLDHHATKLPVLGTVAGDDTLFIVPRSTAAIPQILPMIRDLLQREPT